MNDDTTDWTELREFKAVDLTKSFLLSWSLEAESLLIDIDLCLLPEHAFFEKPRPSEKACIRPAMLEFPFCTWAAAAADKKKRPLEEAIKILGSGRLSGLTRTADGRYELNGDFGTVVVMAERPLLRLRDQSK